MLPFAQSMHFAFYFSFTKDYYDFLIIEFMPLICNVLFYLSTYEEFVRQFKCTDFFITFVGWLLPKELIQFNEFY